MNVTILGAGYVGSRLRDRMPGAATTHRTPSPAVDAHVFRLDDRDTWANPPIAGRTVVWTFAAEPLAQVQAFHEANLHTAAAVIVLGSTSAYLVPESGDVGAPVIDETAPLDPGSVRVAGEEWLRTRGATVLQLAGIFGPGREPVDWLRRRRIKDGGKVVNLVHVDDIVAVITWLIEHPMPGRRINVANGAPVAWRDLVAAYRADGQLPPDYELERDTAGMFGKRVDASLLHGLMPAHRFRLPVTAEE